MDKGLRQLEVSPPEVPQVNDFESLNRYLGQLYQYLLDNSILQQRKVELFNYGVLEDNGTPDVTANHKRSFYVTGGATTITNFLKGYHGQVIEIVSDHTLTIENNPNIRMINGESIVLEPNNTIAFIFMERSDERWYELYRSGIGGGISSTPKILFEFIVSASVTAVKETMDGISDQGDAAITSDSVNNIDDTDWYSDQDYDELTAVDAAAKVTMDETSDQGDAAITIEIVTGVA